MRGFSLGAKIKVDATNFRTGPKYAETLLRSLTGVGSAKPVGYLPLDTIRDFIQVSAETIAADVTARGLSTAQFGPDTCCIKSGALYVYDREALASLLRAQADAISQAGLPHNPDHFIAHIAAVWYTEDHPAFPIIASAFGKAAVS